VKIKTKLAKHHHAVSSLPAATFQQQHMAHQ
jgi:hypothetical protein